MVAPTVAARPKTRPDLRARSHLRLLHRCSRPVCRSSSWRSYPPSARVYPVGRVASVSAAASRVGRRVLTSQYGVGVGRVGDRDPHRPAQVGPQQQVGAGVGVAPGEPAGRRRRRAARTAPRCSTAMRARPARQHAVAHRDPRGAVAQKTAQHQRPTAAPVPASATHGGRGDQERQQHDGQEHRGQRPPAQRDAEPLVVHGATGRSWHAGPAGGRSIGSPHGRTEHGRTRRGPDHPARPGRAAAVVRPPRRRRRRPGHHRRRAPRAGGAGAGADRGRDRAARRVRRAWCTRARGWRPASGSRSSTRRAPSTPATAARSRCCWSTSTRATPVDLRPGRPGRPAGGPAGGAGPLRRGGAAPRLGPRRRAGTVPPAVSAPTTAAPPTTEEKP